MAAGIPLQEYVVKLGAQVDMASISKVLGALKSTKLQTLGVTAALVAAGTAIYKFVKQQTEYERSLAAMAKKQKKSVETVRASENALKAMGKTMKEVARDPSLRKMYDDLVKVNKTMALPNMKGALQNISNLQGAFVGLRSTISYVMQWINAHILANLQEPVQQITELFSRINQWIRGHIGEISGKIGRFISSFAAGLFGIVKAGEKVLEFFSRLPDAAKTAVGAVSMLLLAMKAGPLGWIMMAITAIGDLMQDFSNYKWNKAHPDQIPVDIAFPGIWEVLDDETMNGGEKFVEIGKKVGLWLLEGLKFVAEQLSDVLYEIIVAAIPEPLLAILGIKDKRKAKDEGEAKTQSKQPLQYDANGVPITGYIANQTAEGFGSAQPAATPKQRMFSDDYQYAVNQSGLQTRQRLDELYPSPVAPKKSGGYGYWKEFSSSWDSAILEKNGAKLRELADLGAEFQKNFTAAPNGVLGLVSSEEKAVLEGFKAQLDEINATDYSVQLTPELDRKNLPAELTSLQAYINSNPLRIPTVLSGPRETKKNALGGRYSSRIVTEVAEDGDPEYIIPIKKESRAVPLVLSMLKEMGGAALNKVAEGLGLGAGGIGGAAGAMGAIQGSGLTINNYNTVNASNTINIQASGADGREIGQAAYHATERYLVRTLKGVLGE